MSLPLTQEEIDVFKNDLHYRKNCGEIDRFLYVVLSDGTNASEYAQTFLEVSEDAFAFAYAYPPLVVLYIPFIAIGSIATLFLDAPARVRFKFKHSLSHIVAAQLVSHLRSQCEQNYVTFFFDIYGLSKQDKKNADSLLSNDVFPATQRRFFELQAKGAFWKDDGKLHDPKYIIGLFK